MPRTGGCIHGGLLLAVRPPDFSSHTLHVGLVSNHPSWLAVHCCNPSLLARLQGESMLAGASLSCKLLLEEYLRCQSGEGCGAVLLHSIQLTHGPRLGQRQNRTCRAVRQLVAHLFSLV
jgi:hypothetical protein